MIKSFLISIAVSACLTLFCPHAGWGESGKLSAYDVKAAYLFNFAQYVEWPAATLPLDNSPLIFCIAGKSPLNDVMESLAGKSIKNHRLVIRQYSRGEDLNGCHILFINVTVKTPLAQILASTASRSILTVSDTKGFADAGGIIEFIPVGDKIRFEINSRAAQHANIRISSHLLRLATTVIE